MRLVLQLVAAVIVMAWRRFTVVDSFDVRVNTMVAGIQRSIRLFGATDPFT